ncbi:MAG: glutamate-cysteine ligase [Firmicutes bacterium]|nr:glutamate-cysteine ligase [Bacillota bacterium]
MQNKQELLSYFEGGSKGCKCESLGVEIEHFVVYGKEAAEKAGVPYHTAVSYYGDGGIEEILLKLCDRYPKHEKIMINDHCLGFKVSGFIVTLEPAAQLEISIAPFSSIDKIKAVYEGFRAVVEDVISGYGYELINEGYQPASHVLDLKIIPKERYELMNRWFGLSGTRGRNMMRGTASVQVSIDYQNDEDFGRKYRAAYILMPMIKLWMDNCKTFEGESNTMRLRRTEIWDNVDPARSGIVPHLFDGNDAEGNYPAYGFSDYADYIMNMPPIFIPEDGKDVYTAGQSTAEIFADRTFDKAMVEHLISMVFPDVRLKTYVEIRGADSTEPARAYAYAALVKGTLYNAEFIGHAMDFMEKTNLTASDIKASEASLMENGWDGYIYGIPAKEAARTILQYAEAHLPAEETHYLTPFYEMIK